VFASLLCLLLTASLLAEGQTSFFAPDGYRIDAFRTPVPKTVPGARTIHTKEVRRLVESACNPPVLIDVLPSAPRPEGLSPTTLWLPPTRYNIPDSVWLPNVGYGRLSDDLDSYFRSNLRRMTGGDLAHPVVIYCLADCWMSWNAARRAADYGYSQVFWYPEGTDGWAAAQLPLTISTPVPMQ
jgi:PQQ-dependent catabolism-associated CXXCW motif protein